MRHLDDVEIVALCDILPEQAATVTRVIEAIYKSTETGETVVFN